MKYKGEVLKLFAERKKNLEKSTRKKIKVLQSDNRGEYKSNPFLKLCRDEGIERHFTVRKTLQPKLSSRKDEQDFAKVGLMYVIQCQITKELLG